MAKQIDWEAVRERYNATVGADIKTKKELLETAYRQGVTMQGASEILHVKKWTLFAACRIAGIELNQDHARNYTKREGSGSSGRKCKVCKGDPWPNRWYCPTCHKELQSGLDDSGGAITGLRFYK